MKVCESKKLEVLLLKAHEDRNEIYSIANVLYKTTKLPVLFTFNLKVV